MTPERGALGYPDRVDGVDVSQVQQGIVYEKVAAAGFKFAIVKASEGLGYTDPSAQRHLAGFRAAGMHAIAYAFLRPSQGHPREQVRRLWDSMGGTYGRMMLDLETRNETTSNALLVDFAEQAAEEVLSLGALKPGLYSYPDYLRQLQPELARSRLGEACDLWIACIEGPEPWVPSPTFTPYTPLPWSTWSLHQYGGDRAFRVPGVPGQCDRNLFNGDETALRAWLGLPPT